MTHTTVGKAIQSLRLKEMDSTLLSYAIVDHLEQDALLRSSVPLVEKALRIASFCHKTQTRGNRGSLPRTHYIEHPLRNTLRLLRWGITDIDIIIASILHDCVEDGPKSLVSLYGVEMPTTDGEMRAYAYHYLNNQFGEGVEFIVRQVTNPLPGERILSKEQKRDEYVDHIRVIVADPKVFWVKFSDYIDNGAGLKHNNVKGNEGMIAHLSRKYLDASNYFAQRLALEQSVADLVSSEGLGRARAQFDLSVVNLEILVEETKDAL